MTCLIENMLDEIDGAEKYCKAAHDCDTTALGQECRRMYKELALQELNHFDKLANMYQQKMSAEMLNTPQPRTGGMAYNDIWIKYFKHKAEMLKAKINEI